MLRAYAQLLRLPNVFTAWADVLMGWMVAGVLEYELYRAAAITRPVYISGAPGVYPSLAGLVPLLLLIACSSCLYCAGMVWNDFFDVEVDRQERPWRPIPSGRISRRNAAWLGTALVCAGIIFAALCPTIQGIPAVIVAACLAAVILAYDACPRRDQLGPIAAFGMGACRFLNVILGMSPLFMRDLPYERIHVAGVVGIYIFGVTTFASQEAGTSNRTRLVSGAGVMLAGIVLAALLPFHRWSVTILEPTPGMYGTFEVYGLPAESTEVRTYPLLLLGWAAVITLAICRAIRDPVPRRVQVAVKTCILGLIGLDALMAFCVVGWPGLLILLLLPPALILGKWIYST